MCGRPRSATPGTAWMPHTPARSGFARSSRAGRSLWMRPRPRPPTWPGFVPRAGPTSTPFASSAVTCTGIRTYRPTARTTATCSCSTATRSTPGPSTSWRSRIIPARNDCTITSTSGGGPARSPRCSTSRGASPRSSGTSGRSRFPVATAISSRRAETCSRCQSRTRSSPETRAGPNGCTRPSSSTAISRSPTRPPEEGGPTGGTTTREPSPWWRSSRR